MRTDREKDSYWLAIANVQVIKIYIQCCGLTEDMEILNEKQDIKIALCMTNSGEKSSELYFNRVAIRLCFKEYND